MTTHRPILDAGPGLNFFATNKERLLFSVLGPLCVPETVETEIIRKARTDPRFAAAKTVWNKLPDRLMEVLSDDLTDELAAAVERISGIDPEARMRRLADLGETMVLAHASVAAEAGTEVLVLIDDDGGQQDFVREVRRLQHRRADGHPVGRIGLVQAITVLERAAGSEYLPNRQAMRDFYGRLRNLDDGLPPLASTGLMTSPHWNVT